jgi:hypothetical protein
MEVKIRSVVIITISFLSIFVVSTTKSYTHTENKSQPSDQQEVSSAYLNSEKDNAPVSYKYVGCSFSKKFHRPSCMFARAISKHHLVLFRWRKQAIDAQYAPCRYCLPPIWLSTHCVMLPASPKPTTQ